MIRYNQSKFLILLLVLIVVGFTPDNSFAQGITGKIAGVVKDAQTGEVLPGVNVIVEGTTYGAATTARGEYFILGLPPGIYSVTATILGYQKITQTDVRVLTGRTTDLNFSLTSTAIESKEAVVVTAVRPTIIRDLTATADHVDARVFESSPLATIKDMLNLNAGLLRDTDGDIIIRGGEINQINFYVDGVSLEKQTHQEHGGREEKGLNKTWKMDFNILGVQEMQVITGGFNAEYGNVQSGIVNIVTKEGSTNFHGEFRAEYGPPGLHHFGRWMGDKSRELYQNWWNFDKWIAYNNTLAPKQQYNLDSLKEWHRRYQANVTPSKSNRGGAYDYRKNDYQRYMFGLGGPFTGAGNKLTFFLSGEFRREPSIVIDPPNQYFDYRNVDLTLTYHINPKMKLKMKGLQSYGTTSERMSIKSTAYAATNIMFMAGAGGNGGLTDNYTTALSMTWTHTLNPTTYYEMLISGTRDDKQGPMGTLNPNDKGWWAPPGPWFMGYRNGSGSGGWGGDNNIIHNYRYRFDFTSQINPHNQIKAGSEGRVLNGYVNNAGPMSLTWFDVTWGFVDGYLMTPRYFSGYVQDKMEYGGMIANLGVRYDYFDGHQPAPADPFNPLYLPETNRAGNPATVPNKTYTRISPRIGFSHPISDNTAFHFSYGHFYSQPMASIYNSHANYNMGYSVFNNVNIKPPRTVSYEFGLQHNLGGTHRLNIVVYFNELDDQVREINYYMPKSGSAYYQRMVRFPNNVAYGNAKGFEFTLDRTAVGKWWYKVTYTLARSFTGLKGSARVYSANPNDPQNWLNRQDARTFIRGEDRTHRLTGLITFATPRDFGPLWGNIHLLGQWDFSIDMLIQSGRPFTYVTTYGESLALVGNRRMPLEQLTDFTIKKWLNIGGTRPGVFFRVTNVFNNKIINPFSSGSGIIQANRDFVEKNYTRMDPNHVDYKYSDLNFFYNETRRMYAGISLAF